MRLKVANEAELLSRALKVGARVKLENGRLVNSEGDVVRAVRQPPKPEPAPEPKKAEPPREVPEVAALKAQVAGLAEMVATLAREVERLRDVPTPAAPEVKVAAPQVTVQAAAAPTRWEFEKDSQGRVVALVARAEHPGARLMRGEV